MRANITVIIVLYIIKYGLMYCKIPNVRIPANMDLNNLKLNGLILRKIQVSINRAKAMNIMDDNVAHAAPRIPYFGIKIIFKQIFKIVADNALTKFNF